MSGLHWTPIFACELQPSGSHCDRPQAFLLRCCSHMDTSPFISLVQRSILHCLFSLTLVTEATESQKQQRGQLRHFWVSAEEPSGRIVFFLRWSFFNLCGVLPAFHCFGYGVSLPPSPVYSCSFCHMLSFNLSWLTQLEKQHHISETSSPI